MINKENIVQANHPHWCSCCGKLFMCFEHHGCYLFHYRDCVECKDKKCDTVEQLVEQPEVVILKVQLDAIVNEWKEFALKVNSGEGLEQCSPGDVIQIIASRAMLIFKKHRDAQ